MNKEVIDLFIKITPYLRNFLWKRTFNLLPDYKEFCEDILQDLYIKLHQAKIKKGKNGIDSYKSYIFFSANNMVINHIRKSKLIIFERNLKLAEKISDSEKILEEPDIRFEILRKEIKQSKDLTKNIVTLLASGYKYEEIAKELNVPLGTVKNKITMFKRRFREKYNIKEGTKFVI